MLDTEYRAGEVTVRNIDSKQFIIDVQTGG